MNSSLPYYEKKMGSFYLMQGNNILLMTDEVALLVDVESGTLHKHGRKHQVDAAAADYREQYRTLGRNPLTLCVVASDKWDVNVLNKCLHISGFAGKFVKKLIQKTPS